MHELTNAEARCFSWCLAQSSMQDGYDAPNWIMHLIKNLVWRDGDVPIENVRKH